jgi:hypothetical protein
VSDYPFVIVAINGDLMWSFGPYEDEREAADDATVRAFCEGAGAKIHVLPLLSRQDHQSLTVT